MKLAGAETRTTLMGSSSGRQTVGADPAGRSGLQAKAQPPALASGCRGLVSGVATELAVVSPVSRVSAQELPGEACAIQVVQFVGGARRPPVAYPWHARLPSKALHRVAQIFRSCRYRKPSKLERVMRKERICSAAERRLCAFLDLVLVRLEEMFVADLRHPAGPRKVTIMHASRAFGLPLGV